MSRIFITGASGYIGGDVLDGIVNSGLASSIVALLRSQDKAATIVDKYPSVTPLIGDLDSTELVRDAASEADIVLHMASSNHAGSAEAIIQGLAKTKRQNPVWIQISGASVLSGPEIQDGSYGNASDKMYSDVKDLAQIHEIIASSPKRVVDRLVTNLSGSQPGVRTAILYGPMIYGAGRGALKQRSIQIPDLCKATLIRGHGVHVGKGLSIWSHIHVSDITQLVVKLVTASQADDTKSLWNKDGVYFIDAGKLSFGQVAQKMADFAASKGLIGSSSVREVAPEDADKITAHGAVLLGTNAQTNADRARQHLGWEPKGTTLDEEIQRALLEEAAALKN